MQGIVSLTRINGHKDRDPRVLRGMLGVTVRERHGRSVRVLSLSDPAYNPPTLAELWEPVILSWNHHLMGFQGYEDNSGQWNVQIWDCSLDRA